MAGIHPPRMPATRSHLHMRCSSLLQGVASPRGELRRGKARSGELGNERCRERPSTPTPRGLAADDEAGLLAPGSPYSRTFPHGPPTRSNPAVVINSGFVPGYSGGGRARLSPALPFFLHTRFCLLHKIA